MLTIVENDHQELYEAEAVKYSVIVLLEEESDDFRNYINVLNEILSRRDEHYEILVIANGTEGFLKNQIDGIEYRNNPFRFFALNRKTLQSVCLNAALKESSGEIIIICGSYQQITEDSFVALLDAFDEETDIVVPFRKDRVDPSFNQFQSKVFNEIVRKVVGAKVNDLSCTVRLVRRDVLEDVDLYGNMYRFLPVLASRLGYTIKEIDSTHYQERGKTGFYGVFDYLSRLIDILNLYFNIHFSRKPLRFFGIVGAAFSITGFFGLFVVLIQKLFFAYGLGDSPFLILSLLLIALGIQAVGVGLLAEIIVFTQGRNRKEFRISYFDSEQYSGAERRKSKFFQETHNGRERRRANILNRINFP